MTNGGRVRARRRAIAFVLIATAILLLALLWKPLLVHIEVVRLRQNPQRLKELVVERDDTIAHSACLEFIRSHAGRNELTTLYLQPFVDSRMTQDGYNPLRQAKTAVLCVINGSFYWLVAGQRFNGSGTFGAIATDEFLTRTNRWLFPGLQGEAFELDDYPEHMFSVLRLDEITRRVGSGMERFGDDAPEELALLVQHRNVLAQPHVRIVGKWENAHLGTPAVAVGSVRFEADGRFSLSEVTWQEEREAKQPTWAETVRAGFYKLETDSLLLRYDDEEVEEYEFEFTHRDSLRLRGPRVPGWSDFRRRPDVPADRRNTPGVSAASGESESGSRKGNDEPNAKPAAVGEQE